MGQAGSLPGASYGYPTWIRTRTESTKNSSATITLWGSDRVENYNQTDLLRQCKGGEFREPAETSRRGLLTRYSGTIA